MSSANTGIEWTDKTWNPVTGCHKVSPGCANCYAETITKRFGMNGGDFSKIVLHPDRLDQPRRWRKPSRIFVNSMGDLFHKAVPLDFLFQIFDVMGQTPQHTYQILTKREQRLQELAPLLTWHPNIWMGVSVENQEMADRRIPALIEVPAKVRFLSCEPLLGPVYLDSEALGKGKALEKLHWIIAGGESGAGFRPCEWEWVYQLEIFADAWDIPFFFKQWGGLTPKKNGALLHGRLIQDFPE
ncbi:MAG: DUF5131 family protein [Candidatus Nanopelagicaceae bacterium]